MLAACPSVVFAVCVAHLGAGNKQWQPRDCRLYTLRGDFRAYTPPNASCFALTCGFLWAVQVINFVIEKVAATLVVWERHSTYGALLWAALLLLCALW